MSNVTRKGPPPGDAWLKQIDSLEMQIQSAQVAITDLKKESRIKKNLNLIRQHIKENMHDMPEEVSENRLLGKQLSHIANQIQQLQGSKLTLPQLAKWETQYETARRRQRTEDQTKIATDLREPLAALSRNHQAELAELTSQSRDIANQLQQIRNETDSMERSARDAIAKQQRTQEFLKDKSEIDLLLQPFTTPAYVQLGTGYTDWRKVSEKQPISYSRLEASGALGNSINGVRSMLYTGCPSYGTKPYGARPMGSFPQDIKSAANKEKVKRAQALIRKHSVYLIESGLLSP